MAKPDTCRFVCRLGTVALLALFGAGCSRQPDLAYTPREELSKLPTRHQEQIARYLEAYFGTPSTPRYLLPAAGGEENSSEGANGGAEGEASSSPAKIKLHDHPDWNRPTLKLGAEVYTRQCAPCHGTTGDGLGPAGKYLNPPPRDYRLGRFKFTSTPRGSKPRREDLVRVIRRGAKGTSMPSFRWLPDDELEAVIGYVMVLASRGEVELQLMREAESELEEADDLQEEIVAGYATRVYESWRDAAGQVVNPVTTEPLRTPDTVRAGAKAFIELNCFKCHGKDGRGNKEFNVGKDDWGRVAYAADLTSGMLHGGRRPVDIYRRIYSGINGTPMPAFNQPDSTRNETVEQRSETIWHLVHFVTSIVEGEPLPMDLIEETIKALPVPTGTGDAAGDATAQPAAPTPDGTAEEKPAEAKPAEEQPAEKPAEEKPAEEKPAAEKPAEEKPSADKPAEKPAEEKPTTDKPTDKPAEEKPAADKPAEAKPAESSSAGTPTVDGAGANGGSEAQSSSGGGN